MGDVNLYVMYISPRAAGANAKYSFQNYPRLISFSPLPHSVDQRIGSDCTCPCTFLKAKKATTTSVKLRREGEREVGCGCCNMVVKIDGEQSDSTQS